MKAGLAAVLALVAAPVLAGIGEGTRIIPGHGPLARKTRDEVVAAKPTADLDAKWGTG
jgi:Na+/citrate or Na+/malate symporter